MSAIDLAEFCAGEDAFVIQRITSAPWSFEAYTYATDGRILVRVPRRDDVEESAECGDRSLPLRSGPLAGLERRAYGPLPSSDRIAGEVTPAIGCRDCNGSGHVRLCGKCKGQGTVICPICDREDDCQDCDSVGTLPATAAADGTEECENCGGDGIVSPEEIGSDVLRFPNRCLNADYVDQIAALPDVAWSFEGTTADPVAFRFTDNGQTAYGVLMPMRWEAFVKEQAA